MPELAVKPFADESNKGKSNRTRRIVSYFDHKFTELSSKKVERAVDEMIDAGFTNVVLCITEKDISSPSRLDFLTDTVSRMRSRKLEVWSDLWSVGGVFGGEGGSPFSDSGEERHMGNPKLDALIRRGVDAAASIGADTIFFGMSRK